MKLHITNTYGVSKEDPDIKKQNYIVKMARELGFNELGIYRYPVDSDSERELSTRIDGIIASIEPLDIVFIQLPTGNGIEYETRLVSKIKAYSHSRVVLLFHDVTGYEQLGAFCIADMVVASSKQALYEIKNRGLAIEQYRPISMTTDESELFIKHNLLDIANYMSADYMVSSMDGRRYEDDFIQIGMGLHDKTGFYSSFVGTVMMSIIENTSSKVNFNILIDDSVSQANLRKLRLIAEEGGHRVSFHHVDVSLLPQDNQWVNKYSIGSLFRLLLPRILPQVKKLIYLDADVLVVDDIKKLWDTDMSEHSLAGVHDIGFEKGVTPSRIIQEGYVKRDNYINSGVLIMNLDKIRAQGDLLDMALEFLNNNADSNLPDQDALNFIFRDEMLLLDPKWNTFTRYEVEVDRSLSKSIYHYMGQPYIEFGHPTEYDKLYMKMRALTPWGYEPVADAFFRGLFSLSDKVTMLQELSKNISDRNIKRIIYGYTNISIKNILQFVSLQPGDYFIEGDTVVFGTRDGFPVRPFSDLKNEEKGKFIVIVWPGADGGNALRKLDELGLRNGTDYLVSHRLLFGPDGGYWS